MKNCTLATGMIIAASMYVIHRAKGEHLAMPDIAGIAAGTAVAYTVRVWLGSMQEKRS